MGEPVWLTILGFLAKYMLLAGAARNEKADRVKDFIEQRKTIVLKALPETVSLASLTDQIDLGFKEINTIYESKVHDYRENQKYLKFAKKIQSHELVVVQRLYLQAVSHG